VGHEHRSRTQQRCVRGRGRRPDHQGTRQPRATPKPALGALMGGHGSKFGAVSIRPGVVLRRRHCHPVTGVGARWIDRLRTHINYMRRLAGASILVTGTTREHPSVKLANTIRARRSHVPELDRIVAPGACSANATTPWCAAALRSQRRNGDIYIQNTGNHTGRLAREVSGAWQPVRGSKIGAV
jgi:hypothetical protein